MQRDGHGAALQADGVAAAGRTDGQLGIHDDQHDRPVSLRPVDDLVPVLLIVGVVEPGPALGAGRYDRIDKRRRGAAWPRRRPPRDRRCTTAARDSSARPFLCRSGSCVTVGMSRTALLKPVGSLRQVFPPVREAFVGLPTEVVVLIDFAPKLAAEHVGRAATVCVPRRTSRRVRRR